MRIEPYPKPQADGRSSEKLSIRQKQVMRGICDGLNDNQIASKLEISSNTVKLHVATLFKKLNARTRAQAVWHYALFQGYRDFRSKPHLLKKRKKAKNPHR